MLSYHQCLQEMESFRNRGIHRSLSRMEAACRLLGNPQDCFPSIHIAGTNGKGSTSAITSEILKRSAFRTGLTISPHIQDFRERFQVNGQWIPEENVIAIHEKLKKSVGHLSLTYYEWTILMAFLYFAQSRVDIAVIETGMGGRWDATNVLNPLMTAVTNVSLDHEAYLGSKLEEILNEKMQIFKPGIPAWTAIEQDSLFEILKNYCGTRGIPLYRIYDFFKDNHDESFCMFDYDLECGLVGDHQKKNAALAVGLCEGLREKGYRVLKNAVVEGVLKVSWPGRLEVISKKPFILLDGAHNQEGVKVLVNYLKQQGRHYHLVFGALNDRPWKEMIKPLLPLSLTHHLAHFDGDGRGFSVEELNRFVDQLQTDGLMKKGIKRGSVLEITKEAWQRFVAEVQPEEAVLVTGSLYLVSQVRNLMKTPASIPI